MYAYKAASDVLFNPNYNLWIRVKHYTESSRSAGSYYNMNQSKIFRLAKVYLQETDITLQEALEPQTTDRYNQPWNDEDMSLILRAEQSLELTESEEQNLQQVLAESFDISHPEFDHRLALANLRRNFSHPVDLCKECLHVKHQDELDQYEGCCEDCAPSPMPIYEPPKEHYSPPLTPQLSPIDTSKYISTFISVPPTPTCDHILINLDSPHNSPPLTPTCDLLPNYIDTSFNSLPSIPTLDPTPTLTPTNIVNELRQRIEQQDQLILQLFNRVNTLETNNRDLIQLLRQDALNRQQQLNEHNAQLDNLNF
jgi:hypothetical protein